MRIDPNQGTQALPESGPAGTPSTPSGTAQASGSASLGEDQAQLSGAHVQVQALVGQALQFPEVRQEKVNGLRQVVLEGNYGPSPSQLADSIFAHMLATTAA
jgi:flagellar biosynthesis anti-sigma factor FlgM